MGAAAARLRRLKRGKPQTQTSNCCWNVRAMAVTKQVPHAAPALAKARVGQGRGGGYIIFVGTYCIQAYSI